MLVATGNGPFDGSERLGRQRARPLARRRRSCSGTGRRSTRSTLNTRRRRPRLDRARPARAAATSSRAARTGMLRLLALLAARRRRAARPAASSRPCRRPGGDAVRSRARRLAGRLGVPRDGSARRPGGCSGGRLHGRMVERQRRHEPGRRGRAALRRGERGDRRLPAERRAAGSRRSPIGEVHWQSPIVVDGRVVGRRGRLRTATRRAACSTSTGSADQPGEARSGHERAPLAAHACAAPGMSACRILVAMRAALLTIGNEVVSGDVTNTNAAWLARRLESLGIARRRSPRRCRTRSR